MLIYGDYEPRTSVESTLYNFHEIIQAKDDLKFRSKYNCIKTMNSVPKKINIVLEFIIVFHFSSQLIGINSQTKLW